MLRLSTGWLLTRIFSRIDAGIPAFFHALRRMKRPVLPLAPVFGQTETAGTVCRPLAKDYAEIYFTVTVTPFQRPFWATM
jgi:hypothetical protein